jgi:subtilisin family serine protease
MAEESLRVVNLSFAGPRNDVLSATLAQASRQGMILIAASGNNGPAAAPAYPAADESLIAVTALDAAHRLYGAANRGDYIDFAAPGVDIWTARAGGGGAYRSGTSFAAPYVAAVVVAELALNPRLSAGLLKEGLRRRAQDLGPAGKDPGFGWGLVRAPVACAG